MFGRKKNKEEKREKRRHKPGMTQAEISKLEEVGIRRGFFSKKSGSKHKDEINKASISRPLSAMLPADDTVDGQETQSSVLQRATMYGSVVNRRNSSTSPPPVSPPHSSSSSYSPTKFPIPPLRRKSSNTSNKSALYDTPKQNVKAAVDGGYSVPHSWKEATTDMAAAHQEMAKMARRGSQKKLPNRRTVKLKKRKGGDFGVSLRRSAIVEVLDGKEFKRTIYFAEPGNSMEVDPSDPSRLFRGDQLIKIDKVNVEMATRDEIISRIKNAGDVVTLVVQQIGELDEVSLPDTSQDYSLRKIDFGSPETKTIEKEPKKKAKDDTAPKLPVVKKTEEPPPEKLKRSNFYKQPSTSSETILSQLPDIDQKSAEVKVSEWVTANQLHASATSNDLNGDVVDKMVQPNVPDNNQTPFNGKVTNEKTIGKPNGVAALINGQENGVLKSPCSSVVSSQATTILPAPDNQSNHSKAPANQPKVPIKKTIKEPNKSSENAKIPTKNSIVPVAKKAKIPKQTTNSTTNDPPLQLPKTPVSKEEEPETNIIKSIESPQQADKVKEPETIPETVGLFVDVEKAINSLQSVIDSKQNESNPLEPQPVFEVEENGETDVVHVPAIPGVVWSKKDQVWFINKHGISKAHTVAAEGSVPDLPEGKIRIQIDSSSEVLMVPEDKVEMANEPQFDRIGDVATLRNLNESSMLHTMSQRYEGSLNYSFAGPHLISISQQHNSTPNNYTQKVKSTYKGSRFGDTPPHIYATAQHAHQSMMSQSTDQCIINLGQSGSGKSESLHHIFNYFATTSALSIEKLNSILNLLNSFTSACNVDALNSSRSVQLFNLGFDKGGQLNTISVQAMLLDRCRIVQRNKNEANFNIFYQLLHGADANLRRELFLVEGEHEENPLISYEGNSQPKFTQHSTKGFVLLQNSFEVLGVSSDEVKAIYHLVSACIHLAIAGVQKLPGNRYQFAKADSAQKAASLLGIPAEKLSKEIFVSKRTRTSSSTLTRSTSGLRRSSSSMSNSSSKSGLLTREEEKFGGEELLNCFIISIYSEAFKTILTFINRTCSTQQRSKNSILILDTPGFQGQRPDATFSDLTFNYVQDRLHGMYQQNVFTACRDRYFQEEIDCDITVPEDGYLMTSDLVDEPPTPGGSKGLLWLLDEETSGSADKDLVEKLFDNYSKSHYDGIPVLQRSPNLGNILISHQSGATIVEYNTSSWHSSAYYNSIANFSSDMLQDSKKPYIRQLFGGETLQGSISGLKLPGVASPGLRRAASIRKGWSSGGVQSLKKSACLFVKFQTDGLIDTLKRSQPHFILSIKPTLNEQNNKIDVNFIRNQIKGFHLLAAARLHKQGYPEHMVFYDFRHRFDVLLRQLSSDLPRNSTSVALLDDKEATEKILQQVELSRSQFRIGVSQVLFRSGMLNMLEDKRNEKVSSVLIAFQAQCRGYLARKRLERRKVQVVAVRCIQRNVRKFMEIRQWPWWKILTKVLPLVEVTRSEEELREKQAEIELLQEKLSRIELERDDLKIANTKYENKTQDLVLHLEDERAESAHTTEVLEHETKERIKLEKILKDSQSHNEELRHRLEDVEVELAEKRLILSEQNHVVDSDSDLEDIEYKGKYERAVRDFNFKMKKSSQEHEDLVDELRDEKKTMDRKLIQLEEEMDEMRRIDQQHRKKHHRVAAELSDTKIHLEETTAKNHNLEKKQRKFDSELYGLQADLTELKSSKEKALREKDRIVMEKNEVEKELNEKVDDMELLYHKIKNLEIELEESTNKDTDDRQMVNGLKKQLREVEAKIKDQEEELDEQASTIHILEQTKDRLEMSAEQARQQRHREVEGKDEELEEMRSSYHKRIKQLEVQLEEEEEERNSILKQKRSLEQQMSEISESKNFGHDVAMEKRLRKDLKRYKALLADAQTMIDHLKADVVSKQQMRQLKAQLEDLQYTSSAAVKSRKAIELEVDDLQAQLEEVSRAKQDYENQVSSLQREVHELRSKLEEDAEDSGETLRKYRTLVNQQTEDKRLLVEAQTNLEEVRHEKTIVNEKLTALQNQIEYLEGNTTDNSTVTRLENKAKDLETKLEFQKTATRRLEVQLSRSKENVEKLTSERDSHIASEHREKEALKRVQRQLREAKEEQGVILKHEQDALQKKHDLEMELSESQNQIESLQSDLKLAFKRISDLQISFEELEDSEDHGDDDDSSSDEEGSRWRGRSYGSSRHDEDKPFSVAGTTTVLSMAPSSFSNISRQHKPTKKTKISDTLPIEESMSEYGQKLAKSVAMGTRSVASSRTRSCTRASNFTSPSSTSSVEEQNEKNLDRMSLSLADEDPSMLLYGKPSNIASNLGLGQAKSFQALNESLRAVKMRQNLPEAQRAQLNLRDKIESDIKLMTSAKNRGNHLSSDDVESDDSRSSSRNSVVECFQGDRCDVDNDVRGRKLSRNSEFYEDHTISKKNTRSMKSYENKSFDDDDKYLTSYNDAPVRKSRSVTSQNRSRDQVRQKSVRPQSRSQSRDYYDNDGYSDFGGVEAVDQSPQRSRSSMKKVRSLLDDYIPVKAEEKEILDEEEATKKPFVSRFLSKVRKDKSERDSQSDYEPEIETASRRRRSPIRRSVSHHRREEKERFDAKKVLRSLSRMSARDIERLDLYFSDSDENDFEDDDVSVDDVSLSRYGVVHSPSSSIASSKPRSKPKPTNQRASRKSHVMRDDVSVRSRSCNRQGRMSSRCSENELSDLDVDPGQPVCLDSIISKYLYKK